MAIRLEREGHLIFVRGCPDPPKEQERRNPDFWLVLLLVVLVLGMVFASPLASAWPMLLRSVHGFLAVVVGWVH